MPPSWREQVVEEPRVVGIVACGGATGAAAVAAAGDGGDEPFGRVGSGVSTPGWVGPRNWLQGMSPILLPGLVA